MKFRTCVLSMAIGTAAVASAAIPRASAQPAESQLNLQVRNVHLVDSCASPYFAPEVKITNVGNSPVVLTHTVIRMAFNNPRPERLELADAGPATVFNADGSITGANANVFSFEAPPPAPACVYTPARIANQNHIIAFSSAGPDLVWIPPNGGYVTATVSFRRAQWASPFDAACDDFTKLLSQNPNRPFFDDAFYNLVANNPIGPPQRLLCEYVAPDTVDPLSGIDACTASAACSP
jgi:hypothetical protein